MIFADTFYFVALLNRLDAHHARATELSRSLRSPLLTTTWVLVETADALAHPSMRAKAGAFIRRLHASRAISVTPVLEEHFDAGLSLYVAREDKGWSLTDCISFVVMQREGITEALTEDRHFEQAGFVALMK
jgi:uncharacterized protein